MMGHSEPEKEISRITQQVRGQTGEARETERILADALGYRYDEIDDPVSPCPGEHAIGEHSTVTLAMEAARAIKTCAVTLPRAGAVFHYGVGGKRTMFGPVTVVLSGDGQVGMWDENDSGEWSVKTARELAAGLLAAVAWVEQEKP
jgi:hypothetical protein